MQTRIISAFPGTGKSHYTQNNNIKYNCLDSDSSKFSWVLDSDENKIRNPEFPENYISHIKENVGKYDFIFVSTHHEVRKALLKHCIFFYLIYPAEHNKDQYIQRYIDRGSPDAFIKLLDENWDTWIKECEFTEIGCKRIQMVFDYIESEISHIVCSENGEI